MPILYKAGRGHRPKLCFLGAIAMYKRNAWIYLGLSMSLMALAGCGSRAFHIQLVPTDQSLKETLIHRDEGLFVFDKIAVIDMDGLMVNRRRSGFYLLRQFLFFC